MMGLKEEIKRRQSIAVGAMGGLLTPGPGAQGLVSPGDHTQVSPGCRVHCHHVDINIARAISVD